MDDRESLDTLFAGLGTETDQRRSPFKFLDAYGAADRALFFGRDNEIRDLYARFYQGQVLLVYGESGTGKTSLIECGLRSEIPAEEALFVTVRTAQDPLKTVRRALHRVLGSTSDLAFGPLVRAVIERKSKTLVLVLDQFEEFFLFQATSVRQTFAREVRGWLEREGRLRLVIGLREEYLARATELEPYWPDLFRNRLWIRHLARTDAEAAIVGPCAVCGVALEDGLVPRILADLSGGGTEVELPIFQVVLDSLYRKALAETPEQPRLTLGAYQELGEIQTILGRFLEERVQSYAEATGATRQILKALVTVEGTRQFGALQDIAVRTRQFGPGLPDEQVAEVLQRLIDDRLVREDPDQHWYELRHDALAQQIRQWMSGLEQELVDLRQTLENRLREYQRHGRLLEADLLATLTPYESRLFLRGELAELVELSKRRARQRQRLRFWTGAAVFAVVLSFGAFSFVQWQEAQHQKTQAEGNFKRAREAVDNFFTQVSESTLLDQPGLEPLRRQLLEKALNYYEDLARQRAEAPEMRAEVASAARRTGDIRQLLGDYHGAKAAYRQAIAQLEKLAREYPKVPAYQSDLATSHNKFGNLLRDIGDPSRARMAHQQALDLRERLVRAHPEVPTYQSELAKSHNNLGNLLGDANDTTGARALYQKAIDLQERLVRDHPEVPAYRSDLATSHYNLGLLLAATGYAAGARAAYQQAIDLRVRLAQDHPAVPAYRSELATSYHSLGALLQIRGEAAGARAAYQQALDLREQLVRDHPAVPTYQSELATSYHNLGLLFDTNGAATKAQEAYQQALNIYERLTRAQPEVPTYHSRLAMSYHNLGTLLLATNDAIKAREAYQKALDLRERLARENPEIPAYRSELATSYNSLGILLYDNDKVGARAAYQQAIDLQERLARENPQMPAYRSDLARSYIYLGNSLGNDDVAGAQAAYQQALNLQKRLARDYPDVPEYQCGLGGSHHNLGILLRAKGDRAGARAAFQQALDLRKRLAQEYPSVPEYQSELAASYRSLGILLRTDGDTAGAREALLKASEILARLTHHFPDRTAYQENFSITKGYLSLVELFAKHPQAAIAAASRGLEADPSQMWIRINLAHGYLFDNQYAKALAIYTENKDVKLAGGKTFAETVLVDFEKLRAQRVEHPDMAKIEELLHGSGSRDW